MRAPDETDVDGHQWHSPSYVADWIKARGAAATPGYHAAHRRHLESVLHSLPHVRDAPIVILDLGSGWGRLAAHLLEAFPNARLVALDFSQPMLDMARRSLAGFGGRVTFLERDLEEDGAIAGIGAGFDAIVTSATLHHLPTRRVARLYQEIHDALAPGGVFVGLDRVRRPAAAWLERLRGRLIRGAVRHGATRTEHLRMLEDAGLVPRPASVGHWLLVVADARAGAS